MHSQADERAHEAAHRLEWQLMARLLDRLFMLGWVILTLTFTATVLTTSAPNIVITTALMDELIA